MELSGQFKVTVCSGCFENDILWYNVSRYDHQGNPTGCGCYKTNYGFVCCNKLIAPVVYTAVAKSLRAGRSLRGIEIPQQIERQGRGYAESYSTRWSNDGKHGDVQTLGKTITQALRMGNTSLDEWESTKEWETRTHKMRRRIKGIFSIKGPDGKPQWESMNSDEETQSQQMDWVTTGTQRVDPDKETMISTSITHIKVLTSQGIGEMEIHRSKYELKDKTEVLHPDMKTLKQGEKRGNAKKDKRIRYWKPTEVLIGQTCQITLDKIHNLPVLHLSLLEKDTDVETPPRRRKGRKEEHQVKKH